MKYGERKLNLLTDHVGMYERRVPVQQWRAVAWLMLVLVVLATGAWELRMRALGLEGKDLDDTRSAWAIERRKVDSGPRDQVVIIGDSRILFDTNLQVWKEQSGLQPVQLALIGTPGRPFLHDLAEDEHFTGLVVAGISEGLFLANIKGAMGAALDYYQSESPSQRMGQRIYQLIKPGIAFIDSFYALFALIDTLPFHNRAGVEPAYGTAYLDYYAPWKLNEQFADRQTVLWPRIQTDQYLNRHAKLAWSNNAARLLAITHGGAFPAPMFAEGIADTRGDVEKIRSRGGDVVFVRPPSSGPYLDSERILVPRTEVWDRLLRETSTFGIYFEDYAEMRDLDPPEWSHLSGPDARKFTAAYVSVLCQKSDWLRNHAPHCDSGALTTQASGP